MGKKNVRKVFIGMSAVVGIFGTSIAHCDYTCCDVTTSQLTDAINKTGPKVSSCRCKTGLLVTCRLRNTLKTNAKDLNAILQTSSNVRATDITKLCDTY